MSDLIKREHALRCAEHDSETYYALSCLPKVDAEFKWIPVSERLPSESEDYLVTIKFDNGTLDTELFYFNAEKTRWLVEERYGEDFFVKNKIIAWTEMPEPYRGEQ